MGVQYYKADNIPTNIILRRFRVTVIAVEKQELLRIMSVST